VIGTIDNSVGGPDDRNGRTWIDALDGGAGGSSSAGVGAAPLGGPRGAAGADAGATSATAGGASGGNPGGSAGWDSARLPDGSSWDGQLAGARNPVASFERLVTTAFLRGLGLLGVGSGAPSIIPTLAGSTAVVTAWMAFLVFGKRRRDEEALAPDEVLREAAGHGVPTAPVAEDVEDPELLMPRWRRPSLLIARKADPTRDAPRERATLTFATESATVTGGRERRRIRYAVVRLLDQPDEVMGASVGELAKDDEVLLLERSGAYWLVLSPDGRQGWLHRMTLGEILIEAAPEPEGSVAPVFAMRAAQ